MAKGKSVGEYSLKFTSFTLTPGPAGSILTQGNCEGTGTGFGTTFGTATFVGGKSGTFSPKTSVSGVRLLEIDASAGASRDVIRAERSVLPSS
jgi:hypothetical protein